MRIIVYLGALLAAVPALCQATIIADAGEPTALYKKVNESLEAGNTRLALNTFAEIVDFFEERGRVHELAQNYLCMALSLALNGHYAESVRYHKKALRAHRRYKPQESCDEIKINLGLAYQLAGNQRKARRCLNEVF